LSLYDALPIATVRLLEPGEYRVEVPIDGSALVAVHAGEAEIDSGAGPTRIAAGELARLGRMDRFAAVESAGRPDSFDEWSRERERQMSGEESSRYVSREMVGYEDLDRYGTWESHHHYGYVW